MLCTAVSACAESNSKADSTSSAESSASAVNNITADKLIDTAAEESMTQKAYYADDVFRSNVKKLYWIEYDTIEDGAIAYGDNGSADELSILKLKDGTSAQKALEGRLQNRKTQFENYKPSEMPKLEAALIFEVNGYWVLIVSDNAESIKEKIGN